MELYTVGYEGLNQEKFLALLHHYGMSVVADVRKTPLSRKRGFSKTKLSASLSEDNIDYINFRDLGTSSNMRTELKRTGDYESFFQKYKRTLVDYGDQLDRICAMVYGGEKVALLCFEQDPPKMP